MWVTAEPVKGIPDLDYFNAAVDKQKAKLDAEVERLDEDNYFDDMSESRVIRWEKMIHLTPKETDTLEERQFAIKARAIEKLPYTERVILRDLKALASDAEMNVANKHAEIRIGLSNQNMIASVASLLERKLPLDITYEIIVMFNTWEEVARYKWNELEEMTWDDVKTDENL